MNEQVLAQPVADSTLHPLEQLAATNADRAQLRDDEQRGAHIE